MSSLSSDFRLKPLRVDGREDCNMGSAQNTETPALWTPSYLTKAALLAFAAAFTSFAIILAALFAHSSKYQGLSTVNGREYYLWTYGPTAGQPRKYTGEKSCLTSLQCSLAWLQSGPRLSIESSSSCHGKQWRECLRLLPRACFSTTYLP